MPQQGPIRGKTAQAIARSVEDAVADGVILPGALLPTVRDLSSTLSVSPGTIAAAYKDLHARGVTIAKGRSGTRVADRPPLFIQSKRRVPAGVVDLANGSPDPGLLPDLAAAVTRLKGFAKGYVFETVHPALKAVALDAFAREGVPVDHLTVFNGALDAIERILATAVRPGDMVAVEDPAFPPLLDLLRSHGLTPVPVQVDDDGLLPESLAKALEHGARSLVHSPRAQNPTGAALTLERVEALHAVLRGDPTILIVEDDHAGPISGADLHSLVTDASERWAVVRSISKWLAPDLRLSIVTGDQTTMARAEGQRRLGPGWASMITQELAADLWSGAESRKAVEVAAQVYSQRREHLVAGLRREGFVLAGKSGLNVWVAVANEHDTLQTLLEGGFAVDPGERYRISSPPGVRITCAAVTEEYADRIVGCLVRARDQQGVHR